MAQPRVLLLTFPGQGHINPSLQFAKPLIRQGVRVTFATAISAIRRMKITSAPLGLTYIAAYSDGYNDGLKAADDIDRYILEFGRKGTGTLREFVGASIEEGTRFTHIEYGIMMPWVAVVACEFQIPSTLFWNQPASVFVIYFRYFKDYDDIIRKNVHDPLFVVELLGLPPLASRDMPSFFLPSNEYDCALPSLKQHLEILDEEPKPKVLVNTIDTLEPEALKAIDRFNLVGIVPLMQSGFLDGNDPSDTTFGGDLFNGTNEYHMDWQDSKPKNSVIYVSFGSISTLRKQQMEEIANGSLSNGCHFLWVIRESGGEKKEKRLCCIEELKKQGMIVPWCSQVEVLSHPSMGCFVTHCGWNSTFESLVSGVPMLTLPQLTDQGTNSKLVEDLWKIGVRENRNEEGIVEGHEIKRCIELVMENGERGEEIRKNGKKWKCLAMEAANEDGSSIKNLKAFVRGLGKIN